jgi:signal transduction histidine kinase
MRKLRTVVSAFLGWTAMGLLFALPQLRVNPDRLEPLKASLTAWWAWGFVTVLIVAVDQRLPLSERQIGLRILYHIPISFLLTVLYAYIAAALQAALGGGSFAAVADVQILIRGLQGMMLWSLLVYWLILGGWLAKQYYERYISTQIRMERLERLSTEARMHALRLQLDPHFLFNALNTISSQIEADPRLARSMIEHLGDLLRSSLASNGEQRVPLINELAILDHYLAIQRIRFGARLRFEQSVADEVKYALIPSMTIQPLVENAIRHGISPRARGGIVRVIARHSVGNLVIQVEDDGVGLPPDWNERPAEGLGLSVTRQRLEGFFPDGQSSFELRSGKDGGVEVELRFPLSYAATATDA